ncbi:hypothetical protein ACIGT4_26075 [Streptomyces sioyaensis]|uniref:hypothetical protein n=1 Tax=Streptomyces sioyaensis TaxID=67364 RepID=UPI0037D8401B
MDCPIAEHELNQVCDWMYLCAEHGVTVVHHDTPSSKFISQLDRVERQFTDVAERAIESGWPM